MPADLVAEHQRRRIVEATAAVVAERGYPATSIEQIVSVARISWGTFYEMFPDKESCFLATFDRGMEAAGEAIAGAAAGHEDWAERVVAAARGALEFAASEPAWAKLLLVESQTAGTAAYDRYEHMLDGLVPPLREGRALAPEGDELPDRLEEGLLGGVTWLLREALVLDDLASIPGLLPDVTETLLAPYVGQEAANRSAADLRRVA